VVSESLTKVTTLANNAIVISVNYAQILPVLVFLAIQHSHIMPKMTLVTVIIPLKFSIRLNRNA
jgi:hypothetical protein